MSTAAASPAARITTDTVAARYRTLANLLAQRTNDVDHWVNLLAEPPAGGGDGSHSTGAVSNPTLAAALRALEHTHDGAHLAGQWQALQRRLRLTAIILSPSHGGSTGADQARAIATAVAAGDWPRRTLAILDKLERDLRNVINAATPMTTYVAKKLALEEERAARAAESRSRRATSSARYDPSGNPIVETRTCTICDDDLPVKNTTDVCRRCKDIRRRQIERGNPLAADDNWLRAHVEAKKTRGGV